MRGYVRETLAFVNWCAADPVTQAREWHWQAEPPQVRHAVRAVPDRRRASAGSRSGPTRSD